MKTKTKFVSLHRRLKQEAENCLAFLSLYKHTLYPTYINFKATIMKISIMSHDFISMLNCGC